MEHKIVHKAIAKKRGRPRKSQPETHAPEAQPETLQPLHLKQDAPLANYFVLCNGRPVKNVKELADVMDGLEEHVFNHHVRPDHNDFAAWVKDIFKDAELAQKIADASDRKHMQLVIYKHITHKLW